ncbi:MAG: tol-pal system-associated acyl-CoA thioesterase [Betaproteobacteria bacterium]
MADTAAPFSWPVRVYWEDTDAGGVVFYANYLKFFERARTEWLRRLGRSEGAAGIPGDGLSQQALREQTGAVFIVSHTEVRHLAPARLDDELRITVALTECGRASMNFAQQAWCGERPLAEGSIRVGCVDASSWRPRRIPQNVLNALDRHPPGLPVATP